MNRGKLISSTVFLCGLVCSVKGFTKSNLTPSRISTTTLKASPSWTTPSGSAVNAQNSKSVQLGWGSRLKHLLRERSHVLLGATSQEPGVENVQETGQEPTSPLDNIEQQVLDINGGGGGNDDENAGDDHGGGDSNGGGSGGRSGGNSGGGRDDGGGQGGEESGGSDSGDGEGLVGGLSALELAADNARKWNGKHGGGGSRLTWQSLVKAGAGGAGAVGLPLGLWGGFAFSQYSTSRRVTFDNSTVANLTLRCEEALAQGAAWGSEASRLGEHKLRLDKESRVQRLRIDELEGFRRRLDMDAKRLQLEREQLLQHVDRLNDTVATQALEINQARWSAESAKFYRDKSEKGSLGLEEDLAKERVRSEALEKEVSGMADREEKQRLDLERASNELAVTNDKLRRVEDEREILIKQAEERERGVGHHGGGGQQHQGYYKENPPPLYPPTEKAPGGNTNRKNVKK